MIITLIGFMGSGKSSIGRRLSKKLKIKLIDLDDHIVKKEKRTINAIFHEDGERYFRKLESKYLKKIIDRTDHAIIALGGGTPCNDKNWKALKKTKSFYLKRTENYLFERLRNNKEKRPLIKSLNDEQLRELIKVRLLQRTPYYERADYIIDMDLDKKALTQVIVDIIKMT